MAGIMIVEDEDTIVELYTHMLSLVGHTVVCVCRDGEAALVQLRGKDAPPDLILLDQRIPGATGLQVLASLPPRAAGVPVIFATAEEATRAQAERLGAFAVLVKPFSMERLISEVERALATSHKPSGSGEPASA